MKSYSRQDCTLDGAEMNGQFSPLILAVVCWAQVRLRRLPTASIGLVVRAGAVMARRAERPSRSQQDPRWPGRAGAAGREAGEERARSGLHRTLARRRAEGRRQHQGGVRHGAVPVLIGGEVYMRWSAATARLRRANISIRKRSGRRNSATSRRTRRRNPTPTSTWTANCSTASTSSPRARSS